MTEIIWLLNGTNINQDKHFSFPWSSVIKEWVITWLEVTTNSVSAWKAIIEVTRTNTSPEESFLVTYENTSSVTIDTSWTKKVFIKVTQANINDGSWNNADWTWIGTIQTDTSYPSSNYIPLASISSWSITDEREFVKIKWDIDIATDSTSSHTIWTAWQTDFIGNSFTWDWSWLTSVSSTPALFWDGSDGVLNITSWTTNLSLDTDYNYSSINISAGAVLSTTDTTGVLRLKCSWTCTIDWDIDLTGAYLDKSYITSNLLWIEASCNNVGTWGNWWWNSTWWTGSTYWYWWWGSGAGTWIADWWRWWNAWTINISQGGDWGTVQDITNGASWLFRCWMPWIFWWGWGGGATRTATWDSANWGSWWLLGANWTNWSYVDTWVAWWWGGWWWVPWRAWAGIVILANTFAWTGNLTTVWEDWWDGGDWWTGANWGASWWWGGWWWGGSWGAIILVGYTNNFSWTLTSTWGSWWTWWWGGTPVSTNGASWTDWEKINLKYSDISA